MAATIVSNNTAATFKNSPQKQGEPVDHAALETGRALYFDGVTDNRLHMPQQFRNRKNLTFAVWLKMDADADGNRYIWDQGGRGYSTALNFYISNGALYFKVNSTGSTQSVATSIVDFRDAQWHRLVITKNARDLKSYIDGEETSTVVNESDIYCTESFHGLFVSYADDGRYKGYVSDVQIWDAAWSADDVLYDFHHPENLITDNTDVSTGTTTSNLFVWYPMNDQGVRGTQGVILDHAPMGYNILHTGFNAFSDFAEETINNSTLNNSSGYFPSALSNNSQKWYYSGFKGAGESLASKPGQLTMKGGSSADYIAIITGPIRRNTHCTWKIEVTFLSYDFTNFYINHNGASTSFGGSFTESDITDNKLTVYGTWEETYEGDPRFGINGEAVVSNITIEKASPWNATTEHMGDELMTTNRGSFTNSGGELRNGSELNSGAATHNSFYEITAQGPGSDVLGGKGDMSDASYWSTSGNATITGGVCEVDFTSGTEESVLTKASILTSGIMYKVVFTISGYTQGGVQARAYTGAAAAGTVRTANGTYTDYILCNNTTLTFRANHGSGFVGNIDNVFVYPEIDFTEFGAPDNYPGTVFCMNHADGSSVPTFDANNKAYLINLDWDPAGDNKIYNMGPELFDADASAGEVVDQWNVYGSNTVAVDSDTIKITYVDNTQGAYLYFRDAKDLTTDLVVGQKYRFTADIKVNAGSSVLLYIAGPGVQTSAIENTDFVRYTLFFTAASTTGDYFKIINMGSGEIAWIDNMSLKETDILAIEYVDDANGAEMDLTDATGNTTEDLVVGRNYQLRVNAKVDSGDNVNIREFDGSGSGGNNFVTGTTYAEQNLDFLCIGTATNAAIRVLNMDSGETIYIDDISLKEVGVATGWSTAEAQDTIPQTGIMDGNVKLVGPEQNGTSAPHLTLASTGTTTSGTNYSISAWLMRTVTPGANDNYLISGTDSDSGNTSHNRIYFPSSSQVAWLTGNVGSTLSLTGEHYPRLNEWELWTFVSDSGTKKIYRNTSEAFSGSYSPTKGFDYDHIGTYGAADSLGFEGIIDELAVWNTALSAAQVKELFNDGTPLNATKHSATSSLKSYYKNGHYTPLGLIKDHAGVNHGTITNGSSYQEIFLREGTSPNLDGAGFETYIRHAGSGSLNFLRDHGRSSLPYQLNIEGDFTVMFWRKQSQQFISNLYDSFLVGAGSTDQIRIPYAVTSGKVSQVYTRHQDGGGGNTISIDSAKQPSAWNWYHVAFCRENNIYKVYIDGVYANSDDASESEAANFSFKFLSDYSGGNYYASGFVDEFMIYQGKLSDKDISNEYKRGKSTHKNT